MFHPVHGCELYMAVIHACSILFHLRGKHLLRNAKTIGNEVTAALDPAATTDTLKDSSDVNRVLQMLLNLRQVCNFRNSVRISLLAIPERTDLALPLFEAIAATYNVWCIAWWRDNAQIVQMLLAELRPRGCSTSRCRISSAPQRFPSAFALPPHASSRCFLLLQKRWGYNGSVPENVWKTTTRVWKPNVPIVECQRLVLCRSFLKWMFLPPKTMV